MAKDWRSGTLVGTRYALVAEGRAHLVSPTKDGLREAWRKAAEQMGRPEVLPDSLIKQVVLVLPPWESAPEANDA